MTDATMGKHRAIAVIPVRGGSMEIPRKNARIIGGKPLLAYAVECAAKSKQIDKVYVSTDDAELAEIASRYGAKVVRRPKHLAQPMSTLDEVIVYAGKQLLELGESYEYLVTIQATVPLLKPDTVDRAVAKCREENLETVLSVFNSPHLAWTTGPNNELTPLYEKRVNRQQLPPYYRETGGVVVTTREVLQRGSRFGKRVGIIEVSKAESLDIDSYFDWWLVEKSLARRRICFHIIGNRLTGLGHAYRTLTLADRLVDHDLWFLVNEEADLAEQLIRKRFYPVRTVSVGEEAETVLDDSPDLVINDVLDTDAAFMHRLKEAGIITINFEDIGPGGLEADYLINAMYDFHPSRKDKKTFHGVQVCCLRDEFYSISPSKVNRDARNILVLFGGTDTNNLTLRCLKWLDEMEGEWGITVVLGLGYAHCDEVVTFSENSNHAIKVVIDTPIVSRYIAEADVAITSAGRTVFELASLAVPMVVIAQNEREQHHVFARMSPGIIHLGRAHRIRRRQFCDVISQIVSSDILRKKMNRCLLDTDIRNGIDRVIGIIESALTGAVFRK